MTSRPTAFRPASMASFDPPAGHMPAMTRRGRANRSCECPGIPDTPGPRIQ